MGCASSSTRVAPTTETTPEGRSSREYTTQTVEVLSPPQGSGGADGAGLLVSPMAPLPAYDLDKPNPLDCISKALEEGGVMSVLGLLREQEGSSDFAWWSLDAIAGLMSGDEVSREEFYKGGGLDTLLTTLESFPYVDEVQTRGCWVLAALASDHGEQVGDAGGVEAALGSLTACPESYQVTVAVVRALSNLCSAPPPHGPLNVARVVKGGGVEALQSRLEENPSDGQLQWRGKQLMKKLEAAAAAPTSTATTSRLSATSTRSPLSSRLILERHQASSASLASTTSEEQEGPAKRVMELGEKGGLIAVVQRFTQLVKAMVVEVGGGSSTPASQEWESTGLKAGSSISSCDRSWVSDALRTPLGEEAYWCSDFIFTTLREDRAGRDLAVECKVIDTMEELMRIAVGRQDDKQVTLGLWVLQTLAGEYSLQVGALIPGLLGNLEAMKTSLVIQQAGIKLLASLVGEASGTNLEIAQGANATAIVKAIVASTTSDPQLQYRGVNLLEKLEPGSTSSMPKQASFRNTSMRADEMVRFIRSSAGEYVARGSPMGSSQRFRESLRGGTFGGSSSSLGSVGASPFHTHSTPLLMSSPPPLLAHFEEDDPKGEEEEEEEEEEEGGGEEREEEEGEGREKVAG